MGLVILNNKKQGLKAFDLFSLGFGSIIGVGWSVTLNNLFISGGGPIPVSLGFFLSIIAFSPIALCFAELTPALPREGGVIAYANEAYGKPMGFLSGWFVAMAYISILPWESIAICNIMSYMFPGLKTGKILYTISGEDIYLKAVVVGVVLSLMVVFINWRGVGNAAKFQNFMTAFLLVGGAICIIAAFLKADVENLMPVYVPVSGKPHNSFLGGVLTIMAMAPFYYSGFDTIPQSVCEAKNIQPAQMGKIILSVLVSAGLFYLLVFIAAGLAFPWQKTISLGRPVLSNLLLYVYSGTAGRVLYGLCMAATLAGLFSTWNGFYIAGSRLLMGMGRSGLLPPVFAKEHPKYKTPYVCNIFCAVIMLLGPFLGAGILDPLTILGSTGFVVGWGVACLSAARLRRTRPDLERPYSMPGGRRTAIAGVVVCGVIFLTCVIPGCPGYMGTAGLVALLLWSTLGFMFSVKMKIFKKETKQG